MVASVPRRPEAEPLSLEPHHPVLPLLEDVFFVHSEVWILHLQSTIPHLLAVPPGLTLTSWTEERLIGQVQSLMTA